ncbi:ubiquitin carboxyl-terminal hydrolase 32-like [Artemia franciscana]|uniref:ubiquitin carboxyl-terminal hydrolase 32-like n=1 Tax=Artemia franciscana TaxID=6661 RepID=UPI0032DB096F
MTVSLSGFKCNELQIWLRVLATVTTLEESEILELEKAYLSIERLGRFDLSYFLDLVTIPFPSSHQKLCDRLCDGLFCALDENRDLHIDFKEEVCGISAACRGPLAERLKFAFKVWDKDREGVLRDESLNDMLSTFLVIANFPRELTEEEVIAGFTEMKSSISTNYNINNGFVLEDFLLWSFADSTAQSFVTFISQLFTVYFGLKPPNRREEGEAILSWLRLRKKFPPPNAQLWYLISIEWWKLWLDYVLLEVSFFL